MSTIRIVKLTLAVLAAIAIGFAPGAAAQGGLTVDKDLAKKGKDLYKKKGCNACHVLGKKSAGPDLIGLMERRDHDWVRRWLKETDTMLENDSIAQAMFVEYKKVKMPNLKLADADVEALLHYIQDETNKK